MTVFAAIQRELEAFGDAALASSEAQRALVLAAALDDRAGIQAGGLASTDKRLGELLAEIRERYTAKGTSRLAVLRGGSAAS